jgi:hypothetical protein
MGTRLSKILFVFAAVLLTLPGCKQQNVPETSKFHAGPEFFGFGTPERVTILGYTGDAMEPFLSKDGRYLFFNNRNDPRTNTNLHYAERVDETTFKHLGELKGVNTPVLEGVPSLDQNGILYFVSVRSYKETLSTLYRGVLGEGGKVSGVELVGGVSLHHRGSLVFDAEISADGNTLFLVDGEFVGAAMPKSADITIAERDDRRFRRLPESDALMTNINTNALEYAPAISSDLLELFFTRADLTSSSPEPAIYRAIRSSPSEPFGVPERIAAIVGYAEAPTLSADGHTLYFHKLDGNRYVIYRTTR